MNQAVHVHSEFGLASAAVAVARQLGLTVMHTVHTAYWPQVPSVVSPAVRGFFSRLAGPVAERTTHPLLNHTVAIAKSADRVVSPSGHQARDLARLGVDAEVIPNCDLGPASASILPEGPGLHVAWIGRCVPEKRLLTFVHAMRLAQRRLPHGLLTATVAGDGVLLPVARAMRVRGLRFVGRLDRTGVQALLATAHLGALTSHGFDNQPMTVVEAIRAGRGVIYSDARLTEGLDAAGLLADRPSPAAIATLLVDLALDSGRVERASAAARDAADLFSPERHVERLVPLLAGTAISRGQRFANERRVSMLS